MPMFYAFRSGKKRGRMICSMIAELTCEPHLRSLRATPGLTAVAFALLTVGIAASTIVFSVVDTVVFRRLPFDRPDRLVSISTPLSRNLASGIQVAGQDFFAWRDRQDVLSGLAAVTFSPALTIKDAPGTAPIQAKSVTADLFDVLRVAPALGRTFTWDNEVTGRERVALIGYDLWQRQFGGDPSVVGRTVDFTRGAFEIVGVMPRGFTYPVGLAQPVEMWVPWVPRPNDRLPDFPGRAWMLEVVGRLKDGVTLDQARARMGQIHATLQTQYPTFLTERAIVTTSLADALIGSVRPWMLLLLTAVGLLLLITCVNVANLLLARSITRQRDGAIRTALGATRGRLVRVMLIESAVLSAGATIAGVLIATWGVALAKANLPAGIPRATAIAVDVRVLLIAALAGAGDGDADWTAAGAPFLARRSRVAPRRDDTLANGRRHRLARRADRERDRARRDDAGRIGSGAPELRPARDARPGHGRRARDGVRRPRPDGED